MNVSIPEACMQIVSLLSGCKFLCCREHFCKVRQEQHVPHLASCITAHVWRTITFCVITHSASSCELCVTCVWPYGHEMQKHSFDIEVRKVMELVNSLYNRSSLYLRSTGTFENRKLRIFLPLMLYINICPTMQLISLFKLKSISSYFTFAWQRTQSYRNSW